MAVNGRYKLKVAILTGLFLLTIWFIWSVRNALYPFALGIGMAYLLNPFVILLERKGIGRLYALLIIYTVIVIVMAAGGVKLLPVLIRQLENLAKEFPAMLEQMTAVLTRLEDGYRSAPLPDSMRGAVDDAAADLAAAVDLFVRHLVQDILSSFSYAVGIAISPVLAFYILYDWQLIKRKIIFIVPVGWRTELNILFENINKVLDGVIRGQLITSLLVGLCISLGLFMFDIKYALLLGLAAGGLDIIPYFGAIIGAIPAVGIAMLHSPNLAIKVGVLFILVHQLESVVIQPKIVGGSVGMHPLAVIFFVFIGSEFGGLLGMLASVPLAAVGNVLLKQLYRLAVK